MNPSRTFFKSVLRGAARLRIFGIEPGLIISGEKADLLARVQIGSVQTLIRRLHSYDAPELIIIDEAHRSVAKTYTDILTAYPFARVLGVTATPCRLDGKGLKEAFGCIVKGPSVETLIGSGYLMRPVIYSASIPDLTGVKSRGGDYAADQLAAALHRSDIYGDAVKSYTDITPGRSAIAFCVNVKHATATADAFNAAGISAEILTGEASTADRSGILGRLRSGETKIVCTVDVLTEGFDFEALEVVILLRPTKSQSLYLQMCGRVLRIAEGKAKAVILDHSGNALRHGLVEEDRDWSLDGIRDDTAKRSVDGEAMSVRLCKECFGVHKLSPVCPLCGHEHATDARIPVARAGELKLLAAEELEAAKKAAARKRKGEEKKARTLEDFVRLGRERGYRFPAAWAQHRYSARGGNRGAKVVGADGWPVSHSAIDSGV
ncbi:hypothetical protein PLESTB_001969900 [Pleodorina starrii]|uniref:Helicase C-terminal domain-containing protein n=1 Tax=Pleodorina starrii TaxID=330485 RepID=A0A9W6FCI4_9CHLO|nr:hypothetical protein PLESTB_001969900 [Pleodorina starrii]